MIAIVAHTEVTVFGNRERPEVVPSSCDPRQYLLLLVQHVGGVVHLLAVDEEALVDHLDSIAGKSRPKIFQARKPPEQLLEVASGRACNSERVLGVRNAVDIALSPATRSRVDVRFETFRIGPLAIPAPDLTGSLVTTYLDEDMRSASFVGGWPFLTVARAATTSRFSSPLACSGLLGTHLFSGAGETDRQTAHCWVTQRTPTLIRE